MFAQSVRRLLREQLLRLCGDLRWRLHGGPVPDGADVRPSTGEIKKNIKKLTKNIHKILKKII
jgi:hypothetical protein